MIDCAYQDALKAFALDAEKSHGSAVIGVLVMFGDGKLHTHFNRGPWWTVKARAVLFVNLLISAVVTPLRIRS